MNIVTAKQVARWVGGELHGDPQVRLGPDVVIDSRLAGPGAVFVAIGGERVDGHDFAVRAAEAGAAAVLGTRMTDAPIAHILVADAVTGLSALARGVVDQAAAAGLTVCAITGSSGKTSTKDLLAQLLAADGPTVAPMGSFNNEIGLPLTACGIDAGTRYLVSEMGSRGEGHIAWLCSITPPRVSVVVNVGTAHLGEFGSQDAIAAAKGEIVEALDADGWAVLNADDPRVAAMSGRTAGHVAWFTITDAPVPADAELVVRAGDITADPLQRHAFTLSWTRRHAGGVQQGSGQVRLPLMGEHQVIDACAAAAAAIAAGVAPELVARTLSTVTHRSPWRMELVELADGIALINDAYNANPDSMAAAVATLGNVLTARRRDHPDARAIAVLGDMLELGPDAELFHAEVGSQVAAAGVEHLVAVGPLSRAMAARARGAGVRTTEVADAQEAVKALSLRPWDVVLVKASRGMALEKVAAALEAGVSK